MGMFLPLFCVIDLETSNGDASCRIAYDAKQTACRASSREAQRAYGAARESHNERSMNTLKHATCSHKWWEALKDSIVGVKPSIPALRGPAGSLVVVWAELMHC